MTGIFPIAGVPASAALNTVDVETTCPDTELFYATSGICNARFDAEAMNALISEILNVISLAGETYNCSVLTNLHAAIKVMSTAQVAEAGDVICDGQLVRSTAGDLFINMTGADVTLTNTGSNALTGDGLTQVGADTDVDDVALSVNNGNLVITLTENGNDIDDQIDFADFISGVAGNALGVDPSDGLLAVAAGAINVATNGQLGGVELGTQTEIENGTANGSEGPLVITPDHIVGLNQMTNNINTGNDFLVMVDVSTGQIKHVVFDDLPAANVDTDGRVDLTAGTAGIIHSVVNAGGTTALGTNGTTYLAHASAEASNGLIGGAAAVSMGLPAAAGALSHVSFIHAGNDNLPNRTDNGDSIHYNLIPLTA